MFFCFATGSLDETRRRRKYDVTAEALSTIGQVTGVAGSFSKAVKLTNALGLELADAGSLAKGILVQQHHHHQEGQHTQLN